MWRRPSCWPIVICSGSAQWGSLLYSCKNSVSWSVPGAPSSTLWWPPPKSCRSRTLAAFSGLSSLARRIWSTASSAGGSPSQRIFSSVSGSQTFSLEGNMGWMGRLPTMGASIGCSSRSGERRSCGLGSRRMSAQLGPELLAVPVLPMGPDVAIGPVVPGMPVVSIGSGLRCSSRAGSHRRRVGLRQIFGVRIFVIEGIAGVELAIGRYVAAGFADDAAIDQLGEQVITPRAGRIPLPSWSLSMPSSQLSLKKVSHRSGWVSQTWPSGSRRASS